jgi:DNA-binding MarR family transcriptional regulator
LNNFRSLELYIHLDAIPEKKVIDLISDINLQLASIELQINELIRKQLIQMEQGEADMIRMLDTSRAVRETPKNLD